MMRKHAFAWVALLGLGLSGCGDSGPTAEGNRGTLNSTTPVVSAAFSAAFKTGFASSTQSMPAAIGLQYLNTGALVATPSAAAAMPCDFTVTKINYNTVGAQGEGATATAALMVPVPTASNAKCNGPFPVVLAAHGTTTNKAYDVSNIAVTAEGALYAATFAAQGHVVVAPNYAGYDQSNLPYHPYLVLSQQSKDMQDAWQAAQRTGLFASNGKLFVTGYSQGGAVAMATQRDLEAAGVKVTASAPGSGPYAMLSFGDTIFKGKPNRGGTIFSPLLIDGAQKAYGNLYTTPSDIYGGSFAGTVPGLLPGNNLGANSSYLALAIANLLLPTGTESGILGIGSGALFTAATRSSYVADAAAHPVVNQALPASAGHPMRQALLKNDLRSGWLPKAPTQLCGADNDPSVFWENTTNFRDYVTAKSTTPLATGLIVVNLNDNTQVNDPYAALKTAFVAGGLNLSFANAWASTMIEVHGGIAPYCYLAAYGLFKQL